MSQPVGLDKFDRNLDELDAFVDESIEAMDEQELSAFQEATRRIMLDSKRQVTQ